MRPRRRSVIDADRFVECVFELGWHDPYFRDLCRKHDSTPPEKTE